MHTAKKCFSYLDLLSCFKTKYLHILKSRRIFMTSKMVVFRKKKSKLSDFLLETSNISGLGMCSNEQMN